MALERVRRAPSPGRRCSSPRTATAGASRAGCADPGRHRTPRAWRRRTPPPGSASRASARRRRQRGYTRLSASITMILSARARAMPRLRAAASPRLAARAEQQDRHIDGWPSMNRRTTSTPVVGRVVVDHDDLDGDVARRDDRLERLGDDVGVVVQRHDHAHLGRAPPARGRAAYAGVACSVTWSADRRSATRARTDSMSRRWRCSATSAVKTRSRTAAAGRNSRSSGPWARRSGCAAPPRPPPARAHGRSRRSMPLEDRAERRRPAGCSSSTASAAAAPISARRAGSSSSSATVAARSSVSTKCTPGAQRLVAGARLGDDDAAVRHRLDHARPLEVAGTPVVAVDVDEDLGAGEQRGTSRRRTPGRARRCATGAVKRNSRRSDRRSCEHRGERGEQSASAGVSPPRNSTSTSRAGAAAPPSTRRRRARAARRAPAANAGPRRRGR